jgi:hypothetical protein
MRLEGIFSFTVAVVLNKFKLIGLCPATLNVKLFAAVYSVVPVLFATTVTV